MGDEGHRSPASAIASRCARALIRAGLAIAGLAAVAAAEETGWLEQPYLTGDWNGARTRLADRGFRPFLNYNGLVWSNLAGGQETGADVTGFLSFGIDVDLTKLGAWDGLTFRTDFHWWQGPRPTLTLIGGNLAMALSGWEASNAFRVYNIYLRQSFADGRWSIKIGQIAADSDFMISRYASSFLNAAFGDLPSQNLNIDAPVYTLAAPGVVFSGQPWPWFTGRFGAYTGDAGDDVDSNHGFGWELGNNAGYTFFWEACATVPDARLSGAYTLGAIFDTGGSAQFGTGAERRAHYEIYLMIDQALIVDEHGNPVVGAFGELAVSPQNARNVVNLNGSAGLVLFGALPWRPQDALGAGFSVIRFTDDFQQQEEAAGTPVGGGQSILEITYQIVIAPWLVVQPDVQFFFNPTFSRQDAYALGGQAATTF